MRFAAVQLAPRFGRPGDNLERALDLAAGTAADVYVLPELVTSGYQFLSREEAAGLAEEPGAGPTTARLAAFAAEHGVHVVCGLPERSGDELYNSVVLVGPTGLVGTYRKVHLFWDEPDVFAPGDGPFPVFDLGGLRLGLLICFDWVFPEATRSLALQGADLVALPANLVLPWAQRAMVIRAVENRVYTLVANRIGTEARGGRDPLTFTGSSQVIAPDGRELARLGPEEEGVAAAEVDVTLARDKRITARNDVLGDRRPELYPRG